MTGQSTPPRWALDAVLAVAVAASVAALTSTAAEPEPGSTRATVAAGYVLALVLGALLLVRRRWPVWVLVGSLVALQAYNLAGYPGVPAAWPLLIPLYTAAAAGRLAVAVAVVALTFAASTSWRILAEGDLILPVVSGEAQVAVIAGLAVALGDAVRSRRRLADEARRRIRRAAAERERQIARTVAEERLRIARELHDVVAHTLTVVAVHMGVAADALDDAPGEARDSLTTARSVNDEALAELKTAVGVLRGVGTPETIPADRAPTPGLADLPELLETFRAAGLRVDLEETGDPGQPGSTLGLTVYRVVQEALTNVVKHARAGTAQVTIAYQAGAVEVDVHDDGIGPAGADPGNGLIGMRERVVSLGGRLTAEPGERGGFTVTASIPRPERPR